MAAGGTTYFAGVKFEVGDLIEYRQKAYIYAGQDVDDYAVFVNFEDTARVDIQHLNVTWNHPTMIASLRLPRLSSIRDAKG